MNKGGRWERRMRERERKRGVGGGDEGGRMWGQGE